jgi:hypothetical protein
MIEKREKIKYKGDDEDAWICICTNTHYDHNFYLCDEEGDEKEPKKVSDLNGLYVCGGCGRIIDSQTLEVVGQNPEFKLL